MNNYILSVSKRIEHLFWHEEIIDIIFIHDVEDDEQLDQVIYLKKNSGLVVGLFVEGMNPFFSQNRFHDFDDFNLLASYDELIEHEKGEFNQFRIEKIKLYFNPQYNELCALFISNEDETKSILFLFLQNEIQLIENCNKSDICNILSKSFLHVSEMNFLICEKSNIFHWRIG